MFNQNGSIVMTFNQKEKLQKICLWNTQTGALLHQFRPNPPASFALLHPNENFILIITRGYNIFVFGV